MAPSQIEIKRSAFPEDFIFGAATSAYQIEGAWNVGGKGESNWDFMTLHNPESIVDGSNGCIAIDHFNKFKEDVALLKNVGFDSYRFSISWPRILPGGKRCGGVSKDGIKYYNDLIDTLLAEGIKPCATLFHWDVPQCLEDEYGGFLDHRIVEHFCEFAEICFREFGDRVKYWVTLNEPWSFAYCGYVLPRFPPRRGSNLKTSLERALRGTILDHRSAVNVCPFTSSEGDPVKEIVEKACDLASLSSFERDQIKNIINKAFDLPQVISNEGDPVREIVDKACNCASCKSKRENAYLASRAKGYPLKNSGSEGNSNVPFYEEDRATVSPTAQNLPRNTSSEENRVKESSTTATVSPTAQNLPRNTSSEENRVKESSTTASENPNPAKGDPGRDPYIVAHNLILAHAHAVNVYRKHYQEHQKGKIGMTNVTVWSSPLDENSQEDIEAAQRAIDFKLGWFVDPVITGDYPPSMRNHVRKRLPKFKPDEVTLVKGSCDFLGINYYTARYAKYAPLIPQIKHYDNDRRLIEHTHRGDKAIGKRGGLSWFYIVPDGFYEMMLYMKERYNNPEILITENGFVDANNKALTISQACIDETRIDYYKEHLAALRKAMDQGVRLKGYYTWSFLDNFEWDSGYTGRFGICYVDYTNGSLTRYLKNSAKWWMNFLNKTRTPGNKVPCEQQGVNTKEEGHGSVGKTKCNNA